MKIAVIGIGSAGTHHIEALRSLHQAEPIAVSRRSDRLKELNLLGYSTGSNLEDAVSKGAVAAIVASETGSHVEDAVKALEMGLDILIEKPIATNASEARIIRNTASNEKRDVFVACVLRFSKSLSYFRNSLARIGFIHSVNIHGRSYLPDWQRDRQYLKTYSNSIEQGGILRDHIHEIDYAGWLFGWPERLYGTAKNLGCIGIESEEISHLMWESPDGASITISLDYLTYPPQRGIVANGDNGSIIWDGVKGTVTLLVKGEPQKDVLEQQTLQEMFEDQDQGFINLLDKQACDQLATIEEGIKAICICDTVRISSNSKREELVEYL